MSSVPINITASTSVVLVNVNDYYPTKKPVVFLGKDTSYGKLVTVRDKTGTASFVKPIYVSTTAEAEFSQDVSGVNNYLEINQPYGSVTFIARNYDSNTDIRTWGIVNSFAYPSITEIAGVRDLTASTISVDGTFTLYNGDGDQVAYISNTTFDLSADLVMNGFDITSVNTIYTSDIYTKYICSIEADLKYIDASTIYLSDELNADSISTNFIFSDDFSTVSGYTKDLTVSTLYAYDEITADGGISTNFLVSDDFSTISGYTKDLTVSTLYAYEEITADGGISTNFIFSDDFSTISGYTKDFEASTITADFLDVDAISTFRLATDFLSVGRERVNNLTAESSFVRYMDVSAISTLNMVGRNTVTSTFTVQRSAAISTTLNVRSTVFAPAFYGSTLLMIDTNNVPYTQAANEYRITVSSGYARLNNQDIYVIPSTISTQNLFLSSISLSTINLFDTTTASNQQIYPSNNELYYNNSTVLIAAPFFSTVGYIASTMTTSTMSTNRLMTNTLSTTGNAVIVGNLLNRGWASTQTLYASNVAINRNVVGAGLSLDVNGNFQANSTFMSSIRAADINATLISAPQMFASSLGVNCAPTDIYAVDVSGDVRFRRVLRVSSLIADVQTIAATSADYLAVNYLNAPKIFRLEVNGDGRFVTNVLASSLQASSIIADTVVRTPYISSIFTQANTLAVGRSNVRAGYQVDLNANVQMNSTFASSINAAYISTPSSLAGSIAVNLPTVRVGYQADIGGNLQANSTFTSSLQTAYISTAAEQASSIAVNLISARYTVDISGSLQATTILGSTITATINVSTPFAVVGNLAVNRPTVRDAYQVDIGGNLQASSTFTSSLLAGYISTPHISTGNVTVRSNAFINNLSANTSYMSTATISTLTTAQVNVLTYVATPNSYASNAVVSTSLTVGSNLFLANQDTNVIILGGNATTTFLSGNTVRVDSQISTTLATPGVTLNQVNATANIEIYEGSANTASKNSMLSASRPSGNSTKFYTESLQTDTNLRVGQGFLGSGSVGPRSVFGIQYGADNSVNTGLFMNSQGVGVNTRDSIASGSALTVNGQTTLSNTGTPLRILGPTSSGSSSSTIIDFRRYNNNIQTAFIGHSSITTNDFMIQARYSDGNLIMGTSNNTNAIFVKDSTLRVGIATTNPQYGLDVNGSMYASTAFTSTVYTSSIRMAADTSGIYQGIYLSSGRLMVDNKAISFTTDVQSNSGGIASIPLNLSTNTIFVSTISSQQVFTSTLTANGLTTLINQPTLRRWVGVGSGQSNIEWSDDGSNWNTATNNIFTGPVNTVIYDGTKFVAGGPIIATSTDGKSWTSVLSPPTPIAFTTCYSLVTNGLTYIAGCDGTNKILTSGNGTSWSAVTQANTIFTTGCYGIATNGRIWVAVGQGTNSIAYSTNNGTTWTAVSGSTSVFSTTGRCVAYNGTMWMAGGEGSNTLAYSYDGISWLSVPGSTFVFSTACRGIAWNGVMWVAVGQGGNTIAYSYDGISWSGLGASIFSTSGYAIAWNGSLWEAGGAGTNTHAYSPNGINWTANGNGTFNTQTNGFAYSTNLRPDLQMSNFAVYSQAVPNYTTSTNQLLITSTATILNNSLFVNNASANVGINVLPSTSIALDVNGKLRTSDQAIFSSIATNSVSSLLTNTSNLTTAIENSRVINTSSIFASTILASSINTSTLNTSTLQANSALISSLITSSLVSFQYTTSHISANNLFVSSIASYSTTVTSLTASYMSTIGLVTSSMGIGTNAPQYLLDINGASRIGSLSTSIISTQAIQTSSISTSYLYASTIVASNFSTTLLQASNISSAQIFVSGIQTNYLSTPFAQIAGLSTSIISTQAIQASSMSTTYLYGSTIVASNMSTTLLRASNASTVQVFTSSLNTNYISSQLAEISTLSTVLIYTSTIATQLLSTVRFEAGTLAFNTGAFTNLVVAGSEVINNTWSSNILVAGGSANTTLTYSTDNGVTWLTPASGAGTAINTEVDTVLWNGTQFIVAGQGSTVVMTSSDGNNWTSISTGILGSIYGIAYNGSRYVAVGLGGGTVATTTSSPSGSTWTGWSVSFPLAVGWGVAWNGSVWVAVGERNTSASSIVYSTNGTSWTNATDVFGAARGRRVAWNGIYWIAVGELANTIGISRDGITWISVTVTGLTKGYDVAWNGVMWVIVGQGTNSIYYSYDSLTWTGVTGTTVFSTNGTGITWTGRQWVATGLGTNNFATSPDGITWTGRGTSPLTSGQTVGYSRITTSDITFPNLNIYSRNTPNYLLSTNQILVQESSITVNNALTINKNSDFVGIRNGNPTIELDVLGSGRMVSLSTNTISTASVFANNISTNTLTVSSIVGSTIAGTLGTASIPSYTFVGDTNTGIFSPGSDQLAVTTGGTQRIVVNSSGQVGIGTTDPSVDYSLDVRGNIQGTGKISLPKGSVTSPSYSFGSRDGTGLSLYTYLDFTPSDLDGIRISVNNNTIGEFNGYGLSVNGGISAQYGITSKSITAVSSPGTFGPAYNISFDTTNTLIKSYNTNTNTGTLIKIGGTSTDTAVYDTVNKRLRIGDGSSPTQTLDVAGNGIISGSLTTPWVSTTNISTANVFARNMSTVSLNMSSIIGSTISLTNSVTAPWISTTNISTNNVYANNISTNTLTVSSIVGSTIAGTLGTASIPSYTFSGNTNTGIFSPAANSVAITTGGAQRLVVTSAGNVGVGSANPATFLTVRGNSTGTSAFTGGNRFGDTTNNGQFFIEDGTTPGRRLAMGYSSQDNIAIIQSISSGIGVCPLAINPSGNTVIGVNNCNLSYTLQTGDTYLTQGGNTGDAGGTLAFGVAAFPTYSPMSQIKGVLINATGSETQGGIAFSTRPNGTSGQIMTERMRITNGGNVGIGTNASSGYKLEVVGSVGVSGMLESYATGDGVIKMANNTTLQAKNAAGTYQNVFWPRASDNATYLNYGTSGFNIRNNSATVTMFMTDNNRVGINTSSPGYTLDVAGNGSFSGTLRSKTERLLISTNSQTITIPSGYSSVRVTICAGGGGGGSGCATGASQGGGGGGGSGQRYSVIYTYTTSFSVSSYLLGDGGAGGVNSQYGNDGADGNDSTVSLLIDGTKTDYLRVKAGMGGKGANYNGNYNNTYGGPGGNGYAGGGGGSGSQGNAGTLYNNYGAYYFPGNNGIAYSWGGNGGLNGGQVNDGDGITNWGITEGSGTFSGYYGGGGGGPYGGSVLNSRTPKLGGGGGGGTYSGGNPSISGQKGAMGFLELLFF